LLIFDEKAFLMKRPVVFATVVCLVTLFTMVFQPMPAVNAQTSVRIEANRAIFHQNFDEWKGIRKDGRPQVVLPPKDPEKVVYLTFDDGPDPKWTA